jgi:bifunctional non-homologous end joining protein LigD
MPSKTHDRLTLYRAKRDFARTNEPRPSVAKSAGYRFVVQKHDARRLHFDLRLELDGVLLSWACPKGPSNLPTDKRLAVRTEDHPLKYLDFEGVIPKAEYGGGTMIVWDRGVWAPVHDPHKGWRKVISSLRSRDCG